MKEYLKIEIKYLKDFSLEKQQTRKKTYLVILKEIPKKRCKLI